MAGKRVLDDNGLSLYVERAVENSEGTRVFQSEPEEFVVFEGYHDRVLPNLRADDMIYISGYCKGATRKTGGTGSIVAYLIQGMGGDKDIEGGLAFESEEDAAGIVLPMSRPNVDVPTWHRSPSDDIAFIVADTNPEKPWSLRIVTSKNPLIVSEIGINDAGDYADTNDGLNLQFDRRSTGAEDFTQDNGGIMFEDFLFYAHLQI